MQFIRKPNIDSGPLTMFVVTTGMLRGVHRLMLSNYEELLKLDLEGMISHRRPIEDINKGLDDMRAGRGIRTVLSF